jgi:uroporphyrinogen III methyltransferase / synthase
VTVYLVGAGPGDPDLLTVRGLELLLRADVVVHDRLIDARTLALVHARAELIDVGKSPFGPGADQDEINALLVARGREEEVVRLKGGDPYVFGRGAEEALALEAAGVPYVVVPGVSSIAAVPAAAGIPLTLRGVTSTVVVVTGHDPNGRASAPVDWAGIGRGDATIVVFMAVAQRAEIAKHLLVAGRPANTPVAAIEHGTTPEQRTLRSTLGDLGDLEVNHPATLVIGAVAAATLASIEHRPLHGLQVVVTRPVAEAAPFAEALTVAGARAVIAPTIEIASAPDGGAALADALSDRTGIEWVVCTSGNGVDALIAALPDARALGAVLVAAVGPSTAQRLHAAGIRADLIADPPSASGLLAMFPPPTRQDARLVYPKASLAGDALERGLGALGYAVEAPIAYTSRSRPLTADEVAAVRASDAIVIASGSAVAELVASIAPGDLPAVVTIGPATSQAARAAGVRVAGEAEVPSPAGIVAALIGLRHGAYEFRSGRERTGTIEP